MRLFNRHQPRVKPNVNSGDAIAHPEPKGHIHPNYRHLVWFHPSDGANDSWS